MTYIAPNHKGHYTFTIQDANSEVVFVKSEAFINSVEDTHCSNHHFFASGCVDCEAYQYIKTFDADQFEKILERSALSKGVSILPLEIQIGAQNPKLQLIRQQLARALAIFFAKEKKKAAKAAANKYEEVNKITSNEKKIVIAYAAWQAIEWELIVAAVQTDLLAAAQSGAEDGMLQLEIVDLEKEKKINAYVEEYAKNRAAEMIGMSFVGEKLVPSSTAKFVISDTTKDDLEDLIEVSVEKEESISQMKDRILAAAAFSDARAQFISTNETAMAKVFGHLIAWKVSKKIGRVGIRLSDNHVVEDECDELASTSYAIDTVPLIPAHPNCQCTIYAILEEE